MTDRRISPEALDRRHFVRTLGGAILGSGLVSCVENTTVELPGQPTGTVEVRVLGLAPQGAVGTVTVTELDGSDPGVSIPLPDADAQGVSLGVATDVPVGTYRITYTPPANHVITDPDDLEDVTVQANQTVRAEFTVQAEDLGPAPALVFASAWATATGTSDNALTDGSLWNGPTGQSNLLEVVASSGLDFPTTNVLKIEQPENEGHNAINLGPGAWDLPANGSSIWKRIYWRNNATSVGKSGMLHPLQSCALGGSRCGDLWWKHNYPGGSTWVLLVQPQDTAWPNNQFSPGSVFAYDTTYRLEWEFARLTATTWNLHCRIYDSNDVLLYEDADFQNAQTGTLADTPTITTNTPESQQECLLAFQGGEGVPGGGEYMYFGGWAVSLTDWCGPYVSGEGP